MNTTTVRKRRRPGRNRWFDLPHGGVMQIRHNLTPDGKGLDLEVIVVDGKPRWLWMLESGEALGFVEAGEA